MQVFIYCKMSLYNLPPTWPLGHVGGRLLLRYNDLYQRLQLQFYVFLMLGAMDTRNMQSDSAVNKYRHTVASCWILSIQILCYYPP